MKKANILIVDDEAKIVAIFKRFLEIKGFSVITASNAMAAMYVMVKKTPLDLIILDSKMPGMGGDDLVREMRKHGQTVPVILITGSIRSSQAEKAEGMFAHVLFKPVRLEELLAAVNSVVGHRPSRKKKKRAS